MMEQVTRRSSSRLPILIVYVIAMLLTGSIWWTTAYDKLTFIQSGILAPTIAIVIAVAIISAAVLKHHPMIVGLAVALGFPSAVAIRVIADLTGDATTHNLWPLELMFAGLLSGVPAMLGAVVGSLVRKTLLRLTGERP
jgi:hypothetical protein